MKKSNNSSAVEAQTNKSGKKSSTKAAKAAQAKAVEQAPAEVEAAEDKPAKKVITFKMSYDRYYVFFRGVAPAENIGCGCKTALSALRYAMMMKQKHDAIIDKKAYATLKAEAQKAQAAAQ